MNESDCSCDNECDIFEKEDLHKAVLIKFDKLMSDLTEK
jgi:hypothetical protein